MTTDPKSEYEWEPEWRGNDIPIPKGEYVQIELICVFCSKTEIHEGFFNRDGLEYDLIPTMTGRIELCIPEGNRWRKRVIKSRTETETDESTDAPKESEPA